MQAYQPETTHVDSRSQIEYQASTAKSDQDKMALLYVPSLQIWRKSIRYNREILLSDRFEEVIRD